MYVQDRMREVGSRLVQLVLEQGGYIFVCGDGHRMARDVHACWLEMLEVRQPEAQDCKPCLCLTACVCVCLCSGQLHGGMSTAEATACIGDLMLRGRYVRDVWS